MRLIIPQLLLLLCVRNLGAARVKSPQPSITEPFYRRVFYVLTPSSLSLLPRMILLKLLFRRRRRTEEVEQSKIVTPIFEKKKMKCVGHTVKKRNPPDTHGCCTVSFVVRKHPLCLLHAPYLCRQLTYCQKPSPSTSRTPPL